MIAGSADVSSAGVFRERGRLVRMNIFRERGRLVRMNIFRERGRLVRMHEPPISHPWPNSKGSVADGTSAALIESVADGTSAVPGATTGDR